MAGELAAISATRPEVGQQVATLMAQVLNVPVATLLPGIAGQGG